MTTTATFVPSNHCDRKYRLPAKGEPTDVVLNEQHVWCLVYGNGAWRRIQSPALLAARRALHRIQSQAAARGQRLSLEQKLIHDVRVDEAMLRVMTEFRQLLRKHSILQLPNGHLQLTSALPAAA